MSTIGPLSQVGTTVEAINLDVSRLLNWGQNILLEYIIVDKNQLSGWRVVRTQEKGFDRVVQKERTSRDGSSVVFLIADLLGNLGTILRTNGLHLRVDGDIFTVALTEPIASNEAQIFTVTCKTRTIRPTGGFNNKK